MKWPNDGIGMMLIYMLQTVHVDEYTPGIRFQRVGSIEDFDSMVLDELGDDARLGKPH